MNKLPQKAVDLIKAFEGYIRKLPNGNCRPYLDKLASKKYWTPGYNGLLTQGYGCTGPRVQTMNQEWTRAQAERELRRELASHEKFVRSVVTVPINDNQFGAIVSLSYNMGGGNLKKSSLLRKLNAGDYKGAHRAFRLYNKAGGKVYRGLVRRRAAEAKLFATPDHKTIVDGSTKLTFLRRLRMFLLSSLPVGFLTWENMEAARGFFSDNSGMIVLGLACAAWFVFKWVESKSIEDAEERRYIPSGLEEYYKPVEIDPIVGVDDTVDELEKFDWFVTDEDYLDARIGDKFDVDNGLDDEPV